MDRQTDIMPIIADHTARGDRLIKMTKTLPERHKLAHNAVLQTDGHHDAKGRPWYHTT